MCESESCFEKTLKFGQLILCKFLLENGLKGSPGGVVQPHDVLGEGQHIPPVGLGDPLLDPLLDPGLEFVAAEEI